MQDAPENVKRFFLVEWPSIYKFNINNGKPNKPQKGVFKNKTSFELWIRDGRHFIFKIAEKEEAESFADLLYTKCFFGKTYADMLNSNAFKFKLEDEPITSMEPINGWDIG